MVWPAVLARSLQVERPERRFCFFPQPAEGVSVSERPRGRVGGGSFPAQAGTTRPTAQKRSLPGFVAAWLAGWALA